MSFLVVPNALSEAIQAKISTAIAASDDPTEAEKGREMFYEELLRFYDDHGYIPEFSLTKQVKP